MKKSSQKGFSLIEIMVVLVIIGLLASIVGPRVIGQAEEARKKKAVADFANLATALKMYKLDNFIYPSTEQGLQGLVTPSDISPSPKNFRQGGYMDKLPKDPWGNEYLYLSPGDNGAFDIYTYGADGIAGGEGESADMGNWEDVQ
ncbi:MAG: type II secretion system major pseudopilin GspG [Sinobacterium sp.]|nr:type II secretion system major pseudopilin GspG [Sinobacterium sp.]